MMCLKKPKKYLLLLAILTSLGSQPAFSNLGQQTTPNGAAFVNACAGTGLSSEPDPGYAYNGGISDANVNCANSTSTVGGTASLPGPVTNSGILNGYSYSNSANAIATVGTLKLDASNTATPYSSFAGSTASAGWNDNFNINGGTGNGIWLAPIVINAQLDAVNNGASGNLQVEAYANNSWLASGGTSQLTQAFNLFTADNVTHNGPVYSSWGYQMVEFGTTSWGPSDSATLEHMTVNNKVLWFAIPFTYGTPFEAGFYASVLAGERSAGASSIVTNTHINAWDTISWGGAGYIVNSDNSINNNFNITSTSGFDYTSAVPVPAAFWQFLTGLLVFAFLGLPRFCRRLNPSGYLRV